MKIWNKIWISSKAHNLYQVVLSLEENKIAPLRIIKLKKLRILSVMLERNSTASSAAIGVGVSDCKFVWIFFAFVQAIGNNKKKYL